MDPDVWMQGTVFALVCTQLVVLWYLYRRSDRSAITDESDADRSMAASDRTQGRAVVCPNCGTANVPEYRFCQHCVTELPGRANRPGAAGTPRERGLS